MVEDEWPDFCIQSRSLWASVVRLDTTSISLGTTPLTYVLKGDFITPDKELEGELVIEGDTITCIAEECDDPPGATRLSMTNAYVFPGLVDAHNHVAYNILPKWNPPKLYQNRAQWQRAAAYKTFKAPYTLLKDQKKLFCEMVKYGEVKALLGGITTIQGTSPNMTCFRTLIRNAENQSELGLADAHIRTSILDIRTFNSLIDWTVTKAFVVHLSEGLGTDAPSREEFAILKQKGLLKQQTAIIHGTAFGETEFSEDGTG